MLNGIITMGIVALYTLGLGLLAYLLPKVVDYVKWFIKWNFRR